MILNENDVNALINLSKKAGEIVIGIYDLDNFEVESKSDNSPLTKADKASNKIIEDGLKNQYPDIPILSEEGREIPFEERKNWNQFWLVDPLDGTKEFIKRNGVTTGCLDQLEIDFENLASSRVRRKQRGPLRPPLIPLMKNLRLSVQSQNQWQLVEGRKHHGHAIVFKDVGRGFISASGQIQPQDFVVVHHPETIHPLGRHIDKSFSPCGSDKK